MLLLLQGVPPWGMGFTLNFKVNAVLPLLGTYLAPWWVPNDAPLAAPTALGSASDRANCFGVALLHAGGR